MEKTVKELKNALDISWDRHKEEYEKKGWDKEYFYSAALSQINYLNKINGIDIQSLEKELGFITREYNYRSNLSEAIILFKTVPGPTDGNWSISPTSTSFVPKYTALTK